MWGNLNGKNAKRIKTIPVYSFSTPFMQIICAELKKNALSHRGAISPPLAFIIKTLFLANIPACSDSITSCSWMHKQKCESRYSSYCFNFPNLMHLSFRCSLSLESACLHRSTLHQEKDLWQLWEKPFRLKIMLHPDLIKGHKTNE